MNHLKAYGKGSNYFFIIALIAMAGCGDYMLPPPPLYLSGAQHTHLLDKKGEINAAIYAGSNGFDLQGAYAVSNHIGIIGAASMAFGRNPTDTSGAIGQDPYWGTHEHGYGEIGLVYFTRLGEKGRFELMSGSGWGSASAFGGVYFDDNSSTKDGIEGTFEASYNKIFLQSNIGLETGALETGVALRFGWVTFNNIQTAEGPLNISQTATFFEPSLFVRLGWETVKFELQVGIVEPLGDEDLIYEWRSTAASLGVHFNFNTQ